MKKIFFLLSFVSCFLFYSCDPTHYYEFIIENNCYYELKVVTSYHYGVNDTIFIHPQSDSKFYYNEGLGKSSKMEEIRHIFSSIIINNSNINFINLKYWRKEEYKKQGYTTYVKYYLTVNPEDFE